MPHLKELVELHQDSPFALVGVNSNDSEAKYTKGLKQHGVTWLSIYQGKANSISNLYKVRGYPTMVLVDHEGKIISRNARGSQLDQLIKDAIERAEEAAQ
ncbi:MAG: thioredoxin-related protein [Planctomycetota bacterium]|jgi:thioredoxin-related protein